MPELGQLVPVDDLRQAWPKEVDDFTPWLAEENLDLLSETLGTTLDLSSTEVRAGGYRADIVAKMADGSTVVIENQLGDFDHDHIGKAITYAAVLDATTIVWIAKRFNDEHRAALDWLNNASAGQFSFFGVEVKLWKINGSKPAPQLAIVSRPNDWAREVAAGPRTDKEQEQVDYWSGVSDEILKKNCGIKPMKSRPETYAFYSIGRANFRLRASFSPRKRQLAFALMIWGPYALAFGELLSQDRVAINNELKPLAADWKLKGEGAKSTTVTVVNSDCDPTNRADWPAQFEWIAESACRFDNVFRERIGNLDHSEYLPDQPEDPD